MTGSAGGASSRCSPAGCSTATRPSDVTAGTRSFSVCAFAYLVSFAVHHLLAPRFEPTRPSAPPERGPMKPFVHEISCSRARRRASSTTAPRRTCRSSTTTATSRPSRSRTTTASARSPRSGWTATTTSGARCARTACPSASAPATRRTGRSSRPGRARCRRRCATRSITGRTWSCKRPFGIERAARTRHGARDLRRAATTSCSEDGFTTQGLLAQWKVAVVCTTDDPVDSLEHHARARAPARTPKTRVYPTWRPDKALAVEDVRPPGTPGSSKLEAAAAVSIATYDDLLEALEKRHAFFHERGCRASDHGLERIDAEPCTDAEVGRDVRRGCARGGRSTPRRPRVPRRRSCTGSRSSTTRAAGCSSSTSARCATTTRACSGARPRHRLRLDRRLRAGPPARALPRPARRERPAREDHPLQPEPARQRAHGDDDRQLPGRLARPGRCSSAAPGGSSTSSTAWRSRCARSQHGPALALRRHAHRLAELPLVLAPRVLPPAALQHARRRRAARPAAGRPPGPRRPGARTSSFFNARDYFGFPLGSAAGEHVRAPRRA